MPDRPTADGSDDDLYELAPTAPVASGPAKPSAGAVPPPGPLTLGDRGTAGAVAAEFDERAFKDLHLPLILLCGGIVIEVVAAGVKTGAIEPAMRYVGVHLIIGTVLMLVGVVLAARWRGIELGRFWTVVLKLAAITVGPTAIALLASPVLNAVPFGGIVGWIGEFVLYFALLGVLFDLDESDTWYCVCVIFLMQLAVYFLLLAVVSRWG